jgi:hypothetical protein
MAQTVNKSLRYSRSAKGRATKAAYAREHRWQLWSTRLKTRYGITGEQYYRMLAEQGHACAVCRRRIGSVSMKSLGNLPGAQGLAHVDHCHLTNIVRGILCAACNRAIGLIRDNPGTARAMADYLERPR